jgi:streptogramin lyase
VGISRARFFLVAVLVALGAGTTTANAHEPAVTEFQAGLSANGGPWDIAKGHDGKLWFTEDVFGAFGTVGAGDGLLTEFPGLLLLGNPKGMAKGPDGNFWIAESGAGGAIARVTPEGAVTEFSAGLTAGDPWDIAAGPDGNMWFVSRSAAFVGRITPAGTITEFSSGLTPGSAPTAIAAGDDGNLWFTESAAPGRIGRITPDGVITEDSIGLTPNMAPTDITAGPDGHLWFTLSGGDGAIGRITSEGRIDQFDKGLTPGSAPTGIATGTDGNLWFTESASPGRVGRVTTGGQITEYSDGLTPDRAPWLITAGPDGNMWFTENAAPGAIARISLPPLVRTHGVGAAVSDNSALLQAGVRPNAQVTRYRFEWGSGKSLNQFTRWISAGDGWESLEASTRIANLKPEKAYAYRIVAENDSGTSKGGVGTFTTHALAPDLGELVVAEPRGRVRFKRPGGRWRPLRAVGAELPVGVALDTRRGSITLTSASRKGTTQAGVFGGGILQVRQPKRAGGRVDLHLRGGNFGRCGRPGRARRGSRASAVASASRNRRVRRLWARDDGGRYRTYGRHSHATVRGTRWLTVDRCNGTLTRVTEGAVVVRDLARRRNVLVHAGGSYLAHRVRRR